MDKIYAMQLFIRVAELESFSRAADTLGLPKGSVSRQIQALENLLGTRLLYRTTRRVQLTHDGMVYYESAKDLLSNLEDLNGMFQHLPGSISGRLRVDIPVSMAKSLVLPHLPTFLQQYPGVELELCSSDRQVDVIREGFDCVLHVGMLKESGLAVRPLGKLTRVNCASQDYVARFGFPLTLDDLAGHAMIHYAVNSEMPTPGFEWMEESTPRWITTGGALSVNNSETYHAACLAGLGIIQAPRIGVKEALRNGQLVDILPQYRAHPLPVSILYPPRRSLPRRVHLFMEWLAKIMKHDLE